MNKMNYWRKEKMRILKLHLNFLLLLLLLLLLLSQLGFFVNFEFGKQKKIQNVDLKYHVTLKI
jgi:hypothetical protein